MPNELDIAKGIRDGELPSPQKFGDNLWLFAMRITGTGTAYRSKLDEFVFRDPDIFLTDEFLERCQGLPVIVQHPKSNKLDSKEFAERAVGAIMLPFLRDCEVWGVARVYDQQTAEAMQNWRLSTSPAVVMRKDDSRSMEVKDGRTLVLEGEPYLIDHLAICEEGVWDKDGDAGPGIDVQQTIGEATMADDKGGGTELDKMLAKLDDCMSKFDSGMEKIGDLHSRMDALERGARDEADDEPGRQPGKAKQVVADRNKKRGDDDDTKPGYVNAMGDAQAKADNAFSAWGERAPRWLQGESLMDFRRRLLGHHLRHSKRYAGSDLSTITDAQIFSNVEAQVYADSIEASTAPESIGPGRLRAVSERTPAGHSVVRYYGDPAAWMDQFAGARRYVTKIARPQDFRH
jgi:hypothetical protein